MMANEIMILALKMLGMFTAGLIFICCGCLLLVMVALAVSIADELYQIYIKKYFEKLRERIEREKAKRNGEQV